ncbi:MLO10 [Acrasis kona]|uniref:MLO10 n=1 Tax=Acrasis kona TaxID=1008807 RepID=A0AAW2ZG83_9EUKA
MSSLRVVIVFVVAFAVVQLLVVYAVKSTNTQGRRYPVSFGNTINSDDHKKTNPSHVLPPSDPNYTKWCLNIHDDSIYTIGSKLNCRDNSEAFSMSFLLAIMVTVLIEYITHQLEKRLGENKMYLTILNKIYKELMMMGLIGLVINVCESLGIFDGLFKLANSVSEAIGVHSHDPPETPHELIERRVKIFDFVHVSLFFLSAFYIAIVILTFLLVRVTWRRWSDYEENRFEDVVARQEVLEERIRNKNKILLLCDWILLYKYYVNSRRLAYFATKHRFLHQHALSEEFKFHEYLRTSLLHLFAELIEVDWKLLVGIWFCFLLNYLRNKIINFETSGGGVYVFAGAFGFASLALAFVVFVWCRIGLRLYQKTHCADIKALSVNYGESTHLLRTVENNDELTVVSTVETPLGKPVKMWRYFPFFNSSASFLSLQVCLMVQSFYLAMMLIHFGFVIVIEDGITNIIALRYVLLAITLVPSFVVCLILFPLTIPDFTIMFSIEDHTNNHVLPEHIKQEKEDAAAALTDIHTHH